MPSAAYLQPLRDPGLRRVNLRAQLRGQLDLPRLALAPAPKVFLAPHILSHPSTTKSAPFATGRLETSSGIRAHVQPLLKLKKFEGNHPPGGAGMNERSCHEHHPSQMQLQPM
jgi:hypothetical protein